MGFIVKLILVLISLIFNFKAFSQNVFKNNFCRIRYDCINNEVRDILILKDSQIVWKLYTARDSITYLEESLFDSTGNIVAYASYTNMKIRNVDSLQKDSNGNFIKRSYIGEHNDCAGVTCIFDKFNRLVELKSSRKKKNGTYELEDWYKFYYIENLDYEIIFKKLISDLENDKQ